VNKFMGAPALHGNVFLLQPKLRRPQDYPGITITRADIRAPDCNGDSGPACMQQQVRVSYDRTHVFG
jgi:hypothetical protein